jgi:hypothetical protein
MQASASEGQYSKNSSAGSAEGQGRVLAQSEAGLGRALKAVGPTHI